MSLTDSEQHFWDKYAGIPHVDLTPLLKAITDVMRPGLRPGSVSGFLATPQPDLEYEGRAVTPIQWLLLGKPVAAVLPLAKELGECI